MSRRFPLPRRFKHPLLLLALLSLFVPLLSYTFLFHLLPPTPTLVGFFRGRGPRDLFCGQVLRAYRLEVEAEEGGRKKSRPPPTTSVLEAKNGSKHSTSIKIKAPKLTAKDLIERGPVLDLVGGKGGGTISKLLHQSWMVDELPRLYAHFADEWREALGKDWEWVLWTDADNLLLVESLYPHLLDLYRSFPTEIYRADFSRNLYMHAFGGMYVDLDSSPLPSLPSLLNLFETYTPPPLPSSSNPYADRPVAFLGQMDTSDVLGGGNSLKGVEHEIPNAWMASSRGHPFWLGEGGPVETAGKGMKSVIGIGGKGRGYGKSPEWITGPITLRQSYLSYSNLTSVPSHSHSHLNPLSSSSSSSPLPTTTTSHTHIHSPPLSLLAPLVLLPPPNIYPYSWTSDSNDLLSCTCSLQTRFYDEEWCKVLLQDDLKTRYAAGGGGKAFFVSFWGHSWGGWETGKKILGAFGGGKAKDHISPYISRPSR